MTTLYPTGYAARLVPMDELIRIYEPKMHPEFSRRLFAWIESMGGLVGIGGGWRASQPDKPGVAPEGKSFHQDQAFKSGFVGYAAVDLVARNPGKVHRATTWDETSTGPLFGVHTFITKPPEPWHMQCIEMRGWQTWVNAGRPDPPRWKPDPIPPIPTPIPPVVPGVPSTAEVDDMLVVALDSNGSAWVGNGVHRLLINSDAVFQRYILVHGKRFVNTSGQVVTGWNNVGTADNDTLAALGFA